MKNLLIIFGGQDVEEQAARRVAVAAGAATATATMDGNPVAAFNAYRANGYVLNSGEVSPETKAIIFETSADAAGDLEVLAFCDHHNPGDTGYGMGPEKFWQGSALGQLCSVLGVEKTPELVLVAAGDHCPVDAYAGKCPGIDVDQFFEFRISSKIDFYKSVPKLSAKADKTKIVAAINAAKSILDSAEEVDGLCDLRGHGMIDELPEAAMIMGKAYMAAIPDSDRERNPTGNTKIVLGGATTPEAVKRFMGWANTLKNRVADAYGNPTRGFAGVVVTPAK